jgi:hypothetical protein
MPLNFDKASAAALLAVPDIERGPYGDLLRLVAYRPAHAIVIWYVSRDGKRGSFRPLPDGS